LEIALPSVILHLGAARDHPEEGVAVRKAAVRFLYATLEANEGHEGLTVEAMARYGINARSDATSLEAMRLLPGLIQQDGLKPAERRDLTGPLVVALHEQLDQRSREGKAFAALLRFRELIGEEAFAEDVEDASLPDREAFRRLALGHEEQQRFEFGRRRPRDGVSFGIVPNATVNACLDRANRRERADGADILKRQLKKMDNDDLSVLLPYMPAFLKVTTELISS
jgi:hypothetical protein